MAGGLNTINKRGHEKPPGYLQIKFDKEKNSEEAFKKIKSVLEGIEWLDINAKSFHEFDLENID